MRLVDDLKDLVQLPGFRRLLTVRLAGQTGDGLVQAGLATLFFFHPQNMTTAAGVAGALVVLLLPFCLVGPFTGPFIDRWRRRQTLVGGNLLRAALAGLAALVLGLWGTGATIYLLALVVLGVNRFLLAVLSASLPQVVDARRLLTANSLVPSLGGVAIVLGAAVGLVLRLLLPAGLAQDTASLLVAALLYGGAAAAGTRLGRDELGPQYPAAGSLAAALSHVGSDLAAAVRHLVTRRSPALALGTMAGHRFVYGIELVTIILASRNLLAPGDADQGLLVFGSLMGALVAGHGLAVVLTPLAQERLTPPAWVVTCLLGGSLGQLLLVASHEQHLMTAGLVVFGAGVQGAKIAVDTIVQRDTADAYRGRAFSIYDVLFNTAECLAAGVAVLVMPAVGWSRTLQTALLLLVWALAVGYWRQVQASRPAGLDPNAA
ncbi:MFS transporter [Actinomyces weissii]|uniref:MFS transporter n=1 Tax=Actinomyces weissii TaxID=675090 RepID=A0A7T7M9S9_9ACTO|nr:MFS transporter [Actinomyces weissii]QQM67375.1 MFS transporter [Actinomyces weissii]